MAIILKGIHEQMLRVMTSRVPGELFKEAHCIFRRTGIKMWIQFFFGIAKSNGKKFRETENERIRKRAIFFASAEYKHRKKTSDDILNFFINKTKSINVIFLAV